MQGVSDYLKRQSQRRNVSAFMVRIKQGVGISPLPADGRFAIRNTAPILEDTDAIIVNGETLRAPKAGANSLHIIDKLQRDSVVQVLPGFTLLLDVGLGKLIELGM